MKNSIRIIKENIKKSILNFIAHLILILFLFVSPTLFSQVQFIRNGSFEIHKDTTYPDGLTPNIKNLTMPGYKNNELIKCIGFCHDINAWKPTQAPAKCDDNTTDGGGGWYFPTNCGTSDYFHLLGYGAAKAPNVNPYVLEYGNQYPEMRYPLGYEGPIAVQQDSAFIGIRLKVQATTEQNTFLDYKEYVQSKLLVPLTGPAFYEVKYYVSRSKRSRAIKHICALFTNDAPVNPENYTYELYSRNLSSTNEPNYSYITNPQVCSSVFLNSMATPAGFYGWQEVRDTLYVDSNTVYNYITLGNFQSDYDLWNDIDGIDTMSSTIKQMELYFFIDGVSISSFNPNFGCWCKKSVYKFNIEKQLPSSDTTKCCYKYKLDIPTYYDNQPFKVCRVSRYKIMQGSTTIYNKAAPVGQYFNGQPQTDSFCINKFYTSNNHFTLLFYTNVNGTESLLSDCSQDFILNCECNCDNLENFPFPHNRLKFKMVKVDSSASSRCCWDIVIENPSSIDSSSCNFDLSEKYLLLRSDSATGFYNCYSDVFHFTRDGSGPRWQAPQNFIVKPGQTYTIGKLCTMGIPPDSRNDYTVHFVFASTYNINTLCDTVMTKVITCDSIPNPSDSSCCDYWNIKLDNIHFYKEPPSQTHQNGLIYEIAYMHLYHKNTPDFCNNNDTLELNFVKNGVPQNIKSKFTLKDLYSEPINISPLLFLSFGDSMVVCVTIKNKRTLDSCITCQTFHFAPPPYITKKDQDVLQKSSDYFNDHPDEFFDVVPNPAENKFDVIFKSESIESCTAELNDNLGNMLLTNNFTSQKGINRITFSNINLNSGMYFVNLNINGKLYSKKVLILK